MTIHFKERNVQKTTWISPDKKKKTKNQIDYMLMMIKYSQLVINARSYRRSDANSNHKLKQWNLLKDGKQREDKEIL